MFLIDDILLSPFKGLYSIIKELQEAARQEHANEGDSLRTQLSELYMQLETGQITEVEFDTTERDLLDRLDALESAHKPTETIDEDGDEEYEEDDEYEDEDEEYEEEDEYEEDDQTDEEEITMGPTADQTA